MVAMVAQTLDERAIRLIVSQLDAASTLLKFAADDLRDLIEGSGSIFRDDVLMIVTNLQTVASRLNDQSAFILRIDAEETEGDTGDQSGAGLALLRAAR